MAILLKVVHGSVLTIDPGTGKPVTHGVGDVFEASGPSDPARIREAVRLVACGTVDLVVGEADATELAALALTIVIAVLVYRNREEVAHFFRAPAPAPVPTHTVPTVAPSIPVSVLQAAEHRSQAAEACRSGDYVTCSAHLEAAARLDP